MLVSSPPPASGYHVCCPALLISAIVAQLLQIDEAKSIVRIKGGEMANLHLLFCLQDSNGKRREFLAMDVFSLIGCPEMVSVESFILNIVNCMFKRILLMNQQMYN